MKRYRIGTPVGSTGRLNYLVVDAHTVTEAMRQASSLAGVPDALIRMDNVFQHGFIGPGPDDTVEYRHRHIPGFFPTWVPMGTQFTDEEA